MSRDHGRGRDNNNNNQSFVDARGIPVVQVSTPSPKNSTTRFRPIRIDPSALNDEVRICRTSSSSSGSVNSTININNDKHSLINVYDSSQSKRDNTTRLFYRGLPTATATAIPSGTTATSTISNNSSINSSGLIKKRRKRVDPPDDRQRKRRFSSSTATIDNRNNSKSIIVTASKEQSTMLPSSLPSQNNHNNNSIDEDSQKTLYSSQEEPETPLSKVNRPDQPTGVDIMPIDSKEEMGQNALLYHPNRHKTKSPDIIVRDHTETLTNPQKDKEMDLNIEKSCTTKQTEMINKENKRIGDDLKEKCSTKEHTQPLISAVKAPNKKGEQINNKSNEEVKCIDANEGNQNVDKVQKTHQDHKTKDDIVEETKGVGKQSQQKELSDRGEKKLEEEKKKAEEARKQAYEEKKRAEEEKVKADIDELNSKVKNLSEYYNIIRKIGEGTFSTVYEAIDLRSDLYNNQAWQKQLLAGHRVTNPNANYNSSNRVALKRVYSTSSPARLASEVQILHELRGRPCIAPLIAAFRYQDEFFVVMPYIHSDDFKQTYREMSMVEIKCYFRSLFTGLSHLHAYNYIHRDVKPNNFLYDRKLRTGVLIDFGLAEKIVTPRPSSLASQQHQQQQQQQQQQKQQQQQQLAAPGQVSPKQPTPPPPSSSSSTYESQYEKSLTSTMQTRQIRQNRYSQQQSLEQSSSSQQHQARRTQHQDQMSTSPAPTHRTRQAQQVLAQSSRQARETDQQEKLHIPSPQNNQPLFTSNRLATGIIGASGTSTSTTGTNTTGTASPLSNPTSANNNKENVNQKVKRPGYLKYDTRRSIHANRAGTKGFRAPEIILRERYQTGAIDVWSAGVILLSVITGRYPFFLAGDDADAIVELANVFGFDSISELAEAKKLSIVTNLPLTQKRAPLEVLCKMLNEEVIKSWSDHDYKEAISLLKMCLKVDSSERITAAEALKHPFLLSLDDEDASIATVTKEGEQKQKSPPQQR